MTDPAVANFLVAFAEIPPGARVLEPSCGDGALVAEIATYYPSELRIIDTDSALVDKAMDKWPGKTLPSSGSFLDFHVTPGYEYDVAVMNPPYDKGADTVHLEHALRCAKRVVALLRINTLTGIGRHRRIWAKHSLRRLCFLASRPKFRKPGSNATGAPRHPRHDFVIVEVVAGLDTPLKSVQWTEL